MASLIKPELMNCFGNFSSFRLLYNVSVRNSSFVTKPKPLKGTKKHRNLIESDCTSLAARGFLRSQKPYEPPPDAEERILRIFKSTLGTDLNMTDQIPKTMKFDLLVKCFNEFEKSVPNSMLHEMNTLKDVLEFYKTKVITTTPYDKLLNQELPPNLHLIPDYFIYDPENDQLFNGINPFPGSSRIVTGLRAKKKYKNTTERLPMAHYNEAVYKPEHYEVK